MALRALGDDGGGLDSDIAEAFRYAGDARRPRRQRLARRLRRLADARARHRAQYPDTLFVVAAGNGGDDDDDDNDAAESGRATRRSRT